MKTKLLVLDENSLSHHGIKGQKWGQRNGPPYPLSRQSRFGGTEKNKKGVALLLAERQQQDVTKKASFSQKLEGRNKRLRRQQIKEYKEAGLSQKEAKEAYEKKKKLMKYAAIGVGALTITAAAYIGYRYVGRNYLDKTIKSGKLLQTLHIDSERTKKGLEFYASYKPMDKNAYKSFFGKGKYKITNTVLQNAKIASPKSAEKIYKNLLASDKEFAQLLNGVNYKKFNVRVIMSKGNDVDIVKSKFYDALKRAGYSGFIDINDFPAISAPVIFFDKEKIVFDSVKKLTDSEIIKSQWIDFGRTFIQVASSSPNTLLALPAAYYSFEAVVDKKLIENAKKNQGGSKK